ncbi:trehalose-6-phosphate synthase [Litoribacillus peritrichatus]|uniref:Alpha,alpha-trehalose-phosphate synthase (UDP-forming) n=1 Tax=Litoribacillus peritrichatus TaxID=718191 RepID=A0ABP7LYQ6_9GAMM
MKIGRLISLSWYGGVDSQDVVAKQVAGLHAQAEGLWLCVEREGSSPGPGTQLIALNLDQRDELQLSQSFYEDCILPLFHHLRKGFSYNQHQYQAYRRWNKGLAEALAALYRDGDVLWLHDAHWIPLARYLKEIQPKLPIGISLPSSFCGAEVLNTLPVATELLQDFFYFDLISFSRESDICSFTDAVTTIGGALTLADKRLKKDNQILKVAAYPAVSQVKNDISADIQGAFDMASSDKLVLSIDIPSWISNRTNRNQAYELFLQDNPTLARDIVFGAVVVPFAIGSDRTRNIVRRWKEDLHDLNEHWRSFSRKPFRMMLSQDVPSAIDTLYREAKVFLDLSYGCYCSCNAIDFWAAQNPDDPGVLIISKLAIDGNELSGAMVVHPLDVVGVSKAIKAALLMPLSERKLRHEQLAETFRALSAERKKSKFTFDVVEQAKKNRHSNLVTMKRQSVNPQPHHS